MDDLTLATWRKSTRSVGETNCVEVANLSGHRAVRDSKNPTGPVLIFTPAEWSAFTAGVRSGDFD
ncbi:MAG TPA: DUF397 domain-containing protein [Pseudonocardiaceae bacterium]|nr:DUF397 domain-containing protein [Pseudonocardiaceae bacterium]